MIQFRDRSRLFIRTKRELFLDTRANLGYDRGMPNIAKRPKQDPADKPLTDRQRRFVEEYVVDMNATAAAVRAGYSRKSSGLYTTLMGNAHVLAAVEAALARKRARSEIDADRVLVELGRVAFANLLDFFQPDGRLDLGRLSRSEWDEEEA
jgi:phage terminase small subunit